MSNVTQVTVQAPGRSFTLHVFDNRACINIMRSILDGRTYPIISFLKNAKTVVDIGANIGAASIHFALNYTEARIFAFEPCPATFQLLKQNVAAFPQIESFDFGLFDRDCELPLHLGNTDGITNSIGQSSLNGGESVAVRLRNIRDFLQARAIGEIDVLKIDTEGCELPILESIADRFDQIRVIYLEYHDEADRLAIDSLLRRTHLLTAGKVDAPHRGELCYVAYSSFPSRAELETLRIRSDLLRTLGR
jgi:FkbM family methyltransferase